MVTRNGKARVMFNFSHLHTLPELTHALRTVGRDYTQHFIHSVLDAEDETVRSRHVSRATEIGFAFILHPIPDRERTGVDIAVTIATNDAVNADPDTGLDATIYRAAHVYITRTIRPEVLPELHRWASDNPKTVFRLQHHTSH